MSEPTVPPDAEVEGKDPPDPMEMAMQIFAKIAGTSPAIVTEQGTALKPEDVTKALIERGFGMTKIMEAQLKIKQIIKTAGPLFLPPSSLSPLPLSSFSSPLLSITQSSSSFLCCPSTSPSPCPTHLSHRGIVVDKHTPMTL